jgi:hypothetical protein
MALISATRLHLRSNVYFVPFQLYVLRSAWQARRSRGFRGGILGGDAQGGAWTITLWDSDADMRAFRNSGAHRGAMPHLLKWCDEASYTHWTVEAPALPTLEEAYQRLSASGKISKVLNPSALQASGRAVSEGLPRLGFSLKPKGGRST